MTTTSSGLARGRKIRQASALGRDVGWPDGTTGVAGLVTRLLELARDEDLGIGGLPGDLTCKVTLGERSLLREWRVPAVLLILHPSHDLIILV